MKKIRMSDIKVGNTKIPGGWYATVPEVTADEVTRKAYAVYFGSQSQADATIQQTFEAGFVRGLRAALVRMAHDYRKIHGTLAGFAPEEAQGLYVPFENTGRPGKPFRRNVLVGMKPKS